MTRILFITALIIGASLVSNSTFAQFGIKGGLNLSKTLIGSETKQALIDQDEAFENPFKILPSFNLMGTYAYRITDFVSFETGFGLSSKGNRQVLEFEDEFGNDFVELKLVSKQHLLYANIPVKAILSQDVGDIRLSFGAGVYFGIGVITMSSDRLSIKESFDGELSSSKETVREFEIFGESFRHIDNGLIASIGAEYQHVLFEVSYDYGLTNIIWNNLFDAKFKNSVIGLSIGYRFGE